MSHISENIDLIISNPDHAFEDGFGFTEEELRIIELCEVDATKDVAEPDVLVRQGDTPLLTRTGISLIVGLPGSRKSFLSLMLSLGIISGKYDPFTAKAGLTLLILDTEQEEYRVTRLAQRINRGLGIKAKSNHKRCKIKKMRELGTEDRRRGLEIFIRLHRPDIVIIDGVADMVNDPNNVPESVLMRDLLMRLSSQYKCHIVSILHCNIGDDTAKARGHLGAELMRKAEMALSIQAAADYSQVTSTKSRDKRPDDFRFSISDEALPIYGGSVVVQVENSRPSTLTMLTEILAHGSLTRDVLGREIIEWKKKHDMQISADRPRHIIKEQVDKGFLIVNSDNTISVAVGGWSVGQ